MVEKLNLPPEKNCVLLSKLEKVLRPDQTGHGFIHGLRTRHFAEIIAEGENIDHISLRLAAVAHDAQRDFEKETGLSHYGHQAIDRTKELFFQSGFKKYEILPVLELIRVHDITSWKLLNQLPREAQILIEADNLDALGFSGLRRTIAYAKAFGQKVYSEDSKCLISHIKQYHLNLARFFVSPKAIEMAKPLDKEVKTFLKAFKKEYKRTGIADYDMKVFDLLKSK